MQKFPPVEEAGHGEARRERDDDADQGDDEGRLARALEPVQVGLQPRGEHEDDDPQLGDLIQKGGLADKAEAGRAQQDPRDEGAHHLGQGDPLGEDAQQLGAQQDHRQPQQKLIVHGLPPLQDIYSRRIGGPAQG